MNAFHNIDNDSLLGIIHSEEYEWQGTDNGDTTEHFQARKSEQFAAALLLVSREVKGEIILQADDTHKVFYEILRNYDAEMVYGESGNSRFIIGLLLGQWRKKHTVSILRARDHDLPIRPNCPSSLP